MYERRLQPLALYVDGLHGGIKMKQLEVEFVDVDDIRKICLVNGKYLVDEEIFPNEDYYDKVEIIVNDLTPNGVMIKDLASGILQYIEDKEGLDVAWFAFLVGFIAASKSEELVFATMHSITGADDRLSTFCKNAKKAALVHFKDVEKANIISLITYGIGAFVWTNTEEILMRMFEKLKENDND